MSLIENMENSSRLMREATAEILSLRAQLVAATTAIKSCVEYSGNRVSEWGPRAEACFKFLHDYLDAPQQQTESVEAFCARTESL